MRIAVVGSGYVGTVAAACFASVGHHVVVVESDQAKLATLASGAAPFFEPGLDNLLAQGLQASTLSFTDDYRVAMDASEVVFVCVGTPAGPDGHPDMSAVESAARQIGRAMSTPHLVVIKSTVPIGTGRWLKSVIEDSLAVPNVAGLVEVASSPEFLREGCSVEDFLVPARIVIGSDSDEALDTLEEIFGPLVGQAKANSGDDEIATIVRTNLTTAEMSKYASNAFLATKISFANEMARICDLVGADVMQVTRVMGLDGRIGDKFLQAGLGWGGSCFGKDILALVNTAQEYGYDPRILEATMAVNEGQRQIVVEQLLHHLKTLRGVRVGMLGLAFKPGTDDLRDSAPLDIVSGLHKRGVTVTAHDPMVAGLPNHPEVHLVKDPYDVADNADVIVLATDWPEYVDLDLARLRDKARGTLFFDGRNSYDPAAVNAAGFRYVGIGRG